MDWCQNGGPVRKALFLVKGFSLESNSSGFSRRLISVSPGLEVRNPRTIKDSNSLI